MRYGEPRRLRRGGCHLAVWLGFQFYGHAIVIEAYGAVDGLGRSVTVVREHLRPVGGFVFVVLAGGIGLAGLSAGLYWLFHFAFGPTLELPVMVLMALLIVSLQPLAGTVFFVYSVLFYRSLLGIDEESTSPPSQSTDGSVGLSA